MSGVDSGILDRCDCGDLADSIALPMSVTAAANGVSCHHEMTHCPAALRSMRSSSGRNGSEARRRATASMLGLTPVANVRASSTCLARSVRLISTSRASDALAAGGPGDANDAMVFITWIFRWLRHV